MTPEQLYQWAKDYYEKNSTEPTVRQATKRFKVTQDDIVSAIEDYQGDGNYFGLAIGVQIQGYGYYEEKYVGKYTIEAY